MKKSFFISLFFSSQVFSQIITFQKTVGSANDEAFYGVRSTSDGGYIAGGFADVSGSGNYDFYLVKMNASGVIAWTKTFGGPNVDYFNSVIQTSDGGYVASGGTQSFGAGSDDMFLVKTDANGILQWSKTYGGTNIDAEQDIRQTTDGGYIITGETVSFGSGMYDVYLVKTDGTGIIQWTKTYGTNISEGGASVQQTNDGGYIIAGFQATGGPFNGDVSLIKTDAGGTLQWSKTYGSSIDAEGAEYVIQTSDSGYAICGTTNSFGAGDRDGYLIKTDVNGNLQWSKTYGGGGADFLWGIRQVSNGYVVAGETYPFGSSFNDGFLMKTDNNGNVLWSKTYGGASYDYFIGMDLASYGGFVLAGATQSFGPGGDGYIVKTDSIGNSGCFESNVIFTVTSPPTVVANITTLVSSGGVANIPVATIGSVGIANTLCFTVGIPVLSNTESISIFPNPSSSIFNVESSQKISQIEIYDVLGKIIYQSQPSSPKFEIDLSDKPKGIYFVKIISDYKNYIQKVIIQ